MITYAICTDRTPNRATVSEIWPTEGHVRAKLLHLGAARLDICAVRITSHEPVDVGDRIWIGTQSIRTEVL